MTQEERQILSERLLSAFEGIRTSHGVEVSDALKRRLYAAGFELDVFEAVAERILELGELVRQNALVTPTQDEEVMQQIESVAWSGGDPTAAEE